MNCKEAEDRFINNNFDRSNFADMDFGPENAERLIIITGYYYLCFAVYDATGLNDSEREELVECHLSNLTFGCLYRYKISKKIGNTYFCDVCTVEEKMSDMKKRLEQHREPKKIKGLTTEPQPLQAKQI